MNKNEKYLIAAAAAVALLLIPKILNPTNMTAAELIASFEGFRARPYWDVSRWSWGYGTRAPGNFGYASVYPDPTVTITKPAALQELQQHSQSDFNYLNQLITRPLTGNQWAAYLSFSYQEGTGNADNLAGEINSGDNQALAARWRLYNKVRDANGILQYDAGTAARREKELQIWNT